MNHIWCVYVHNLAECQLICRSRYVRIVCSRPDESKYDLAVCPNSPFDFKGLNLSPNLGNVFNTITRLLVIEELTCLIMFASSLGSQASR